MGGTHFLCFWRRSGRGPARDSGGPASDRGGRAKGQVKAQAAGDCAAGSAAADASRDHNSDTSPVYNSDTSPDYNDASPDYNTDTSPDTMGVHLSSIPASLAVTKGILMDGYRNWEDLDIDCLVNVLGRVGIESLLLTVPFVCKSWHTASLDPSCWKCLDFPDVVLCYHESPLCVRFIELYKIKKFTVEAFVRLLVDRSHENCTMLINLPLDLPLIDYSSTANRCPNLKYLSLHNLYGEEYRLPKLIGKWKNLVALSLGFSFNLTEIIYQLSLNCKSFACLSLSKASIMEDMASTIVTCLPKLTFLHLKRARIIKKDLVTILKGCKELVYLNASYCEGFRTDNEVLELASHIKKFTSKGSRAYGDHLLDENKDYWQDHDEPSTSPFPCIQYGYLCE